MNRGALKAKGGLSNWVLVHFIDMWGFDNPEFIGKWKNQDVDYIYKRYFEAIEEMAKVDILILLDHLDL